jgi:hypothetical protein
VDDFASAALVALLNRALADLGADPSSPPPPGARLPLAAKRARLQAVADAHGLKPLLAAGAHLPVLRSDPAAAALLAAADPADLFARWARLERFVHSRHRVLVRASGEGWLLAEHVGPPGEPPLACEDALVFGLLAAALRAIGAEGLTARFGADGAAPAVISGDAVTATRTDGPTALWRFSWTALRPASPAPAQVEATDAGSQLRSLVRRDPARGWSVAVASSLLGRSTRSLQRALQPAGGFSASCAPRAPSTPPTCSSTAAIPSA